MTRKYSVDRILGITASLKPTPHRIFEKGKQMQMNLHDYLPGSLENTDAVLFYWQNHSQPKNKNTFLDWKQYANR